MRIAILDADTLGVHPSASGSNSVRSQSAVVDSLRLIWSREHVRSQGSPLLVSRSHRPRPCSAALWPVPRSSMSSAAS